MNEEQQVQFQDFLREANRILQDLAIIDLTDRSALRSSTVRECMDVYLRLVRFQAAVPLIESDSLRVQMTLERLKANLRFFGEDIRL